MASQLNRGWIPHDEGALGQSAERVLQGDVPHRDFDEIYSGGLSYLNGAGFRVFGTQLTSLRIVLYIFFLAWVPALYFCASRLVPPLLAGAVTLLAVAWGVPNYAAAMPSWYNLFFATFGVAAMLRYLEARNRLWLFVAGLCGGISFLFKVSGIFFVAGILLFFLFPDETEEQERPAGSFGQKVYPAFLLVAVLCYSVVLLAFFRKGFSLVSLGYFFLPELAICAAILWFHFCFRSNGRSFAPLFTRVLVFGAGVALPVAVFLARYIAGGFVSKFLYGVFVLPAKRFAFASHTQDPLWMLCGIAADLAVITVIFLPNPRLRNGVGGLVFAAVPVLLVVAGRHPHVYRGVWTATWTLLPTLVVVGLALLVKPSRLEQLDSRRRQQVFLLLSVTAACSLIQFPFNGAIYFCYVPHFCCWRLRRCSPWCLASRVWHWLG